MRPHGNRDRDADIGVLVAQHRGFGPGRIGVGTRISAIASALTMKSLTDSL